VDSVVVWLDGGTSSPSDDAARALSEWARARGVTLVTLDDGGALPAITIDPSIADRVEKELDRANDAIAALDADAADRALARAEAILREHPELPNAAWLRAEVERSWARRFLRIEPRDDTRAQAAWQNAYALDNGRVAGVGEADLGPRKRSAASILVRGVRNVRLTVRLDGVDLANGETSGDATKYAIEVPPAEHQLVALTDGNVVFASWVAIAPNTPVEIAVSESGSCGRATFASVKRGEGGDVHAAGVTCPSWVAAVAGERPGTVLVARCERDRCGPLLEWRVERYGGGPPQSVGSGAPWPSWATWTLLGIGAATATSVALVATGVFESRPTEPRFVAGGARVE
jgi:hypothetical protein